MKLPEILLMLLVFGAILFLAFVTTRYIGAKAGVAMTGKHIKIIESISLGMDKRLHLVKAGDKYLLIATTSKLIEFISEVRLEAEVQEKDGGTAEAQNIFDFKAVFEKYAGKYKDSIKQKTTKGSSGRHAFNSNLERLKRIASGVVNKETDSEADNEAGGTNDKKV